MIKISFSQFNMRDRAAVILDIPRSNVLNVCHTVGGKSFMVLHRGKYGEREAVSVVTVWQMVDAQPLQEHHIKGSFGFYPDRIMASLVILGLDFLPDAEKLKSAYRKMSKLTHPDNGGKAEEFAAVNDSYNAVAEYLGQLSADS
jgi:hypothetical protein